MLSSRKLPSSSPPSIVFDEPTSSHNPYVTDDQPYYYEPDVESFYDNDMSYMAVQTAYLMEPSTTTSPLMHSTSLRSDRRRLQHTHMSGTGSPPLFAQRTDLYFEQDLHLTDVMGRARYRYTREEMLAMRAVSRLMLMDAHPHSHPHSHAHVI